MNYKDLKKEELIKLLEEKEELLQETEKEKSVFDVLNAVNVNDKTEKKNNLTYLSWAWAWAEIKKKYPNAQYKVYERETQDGYIVNYFTDGRTCWVKTGAIIDNVEYIEELPIMNYKNQSITLDKVTSTDVNKSIQRSLTKAFARHGLGLYIYAGEDLPEDDKQNEEPKQAGADTIKELTELRQEIENLGVDTRDLKFVNYVCEKAKVNSLDSAYLLTNEQGALNVINVYKGVIENKKKQPKQEKEVKTEVVEPSLDDLLDSAEDIVTTNEILND